MPKLIKDIELKCPRDEVLKMLKYKENTTETSTNVITIIDRLIDYGKQEAVPRALYIDFPIKEINDNAVVLQGSSCDLIGKSNIHRLWNANKVTLFVVTIGNTIEKKIEEYTTKRAMSNATILDTIGSILVESAVDYVDHMVQKRAREEDSKTTKRFSPGYGDWDVKEQKLLLKQLKASKIGVRLTKSYLMQPQKSVSGAIGWIKKG